MTFNYNDVAIYDTESNGFIREATNLWQGCIKSHKTGEMWKYREHEMDQFVAKLNEFSTCVAHNSTKHDRPLIAKLVPTSIVSKNLDSLILSQLFRPDRPQPKGAKGKHSLEAHGIKMGRFKPVHEDWTKWSPEMEHRCAEDVEINHDKFIELMNEKALDESEGLNWDKAIAIEHTVADIIGQSERNGWRFDFEAADLLIEKLDKGVAELDEYLTPLLPNRCVIQSTKAPKKDGGHIIPTKQIFSVKTGEYHSNICKYFDLKPEDALDPKTRLVENGLATEENPCGFCKVSFERMDLNSNSQTIEFLLSAGWVPTEFTDKTESGGGGNPKLTEDSFDSIQGEVGQKIALRRILRARRTTIKNYEDETKGWYNLVRDDGKITPYNNSQGTPTGRSRHSGLANVPKNKKSVIYGRECRELFIADEGWSTLGADASGIEARMLAHYINDEALTNVILTDDIHSYNQKLAGLDDRDQAKRFYYAFLYGGGDAKIGSIVGGYSADGKRLKETFFSNLPKLGTLMENINAAAKRGYLVGLDGRKIPIRSPHAALNSLLQSAGAIVMKMALCYLQSWLKHSTIGLDEVQLVTFYHDEFQQQMKNHWIKAEKTFETEEEGGIFLANQGNIWTPLHKDSEGIYTTQYSPIGELTVKSIIKAGEYFNLRCPLDAEYKIGRSWADTH